MLSISLGFTRNAKEVMEFYASAFDYELQESDIWLGEQGEVVHGELNIYGNRLMFTDWKEEAEVFSGFTLSINLTDEQELRNRFNKLSAGAEILMPLAKVEWSECYGMIKDKFGVTWEFNLD